MRKMVFLLISGGLFIFLMGCQQQAPAPNQVERGKYLVTIGGCHDCHTPKQMNAAGMPEPDMTSLLSGHPAEAPYPTWKPEDLQMNNAIASTNPMLTAWAGPWGVSFGSQPCEKDDNA